MVGYVVGRWVGVQVPPVAHEVGVGRRFVDEDGQLGANCAAHSYGSLAK